MFDQEKVESVIGSFAILISKAVEEGVEKGVKRALESQATQPAQPEKPATVNPEEIETPKKKTTKKKAATKKKTVKKSEPKQEVVDTVVESEPELTIDQVRLIMRDVHIEDEKGPEKIKAALLSRNASKLSDLDPMKYEEFVAEIKS